MLIAVLNNRVLLAARRNSFLQRRIAHSPVSVGISLLSLCSVGLVRCMCGNSVSSMETPVIVEPMGTHTATVFFLHGLGDTGHGWGQQMNEIKAPHIKYVCPTAKQIPVTLNGGMKMNSWFDIKSLSFDSAQDEAGITGASDD
ncbi:acyl-protein thioesterase 1-like, partial [Amphiura filiformis]|uniref:acyl-protein thioesterase 1-like n=1 Tax=Amphiura filiformis TaxID=82378 RepID=UPI003B227D44